MNQRKIEGLTTKEHAILRRLEEFARLHNLELFNVKGSLYDRVKTIANNGGACPCKPGKRPFCPCKECIQECKDKGWCFCMVFLSKDWGEKWQKELDRIKREALA